MGEEYDIFCVFSRDAVDGGYLPDDVRLIKIFYDEDEANKFADENKYDVEGWCVE